MRFTVIPSEEDWAVACVVDAELSEDEIIAHFAFLRHAHFFADVLNAARGVV